MVVGASKGRPKAKVTGSGELIIKRRTHLSVVLGITFCVIAPSRAAYP